MILKKLKTQPYQDSIVASDLKYYHQLILL